MFDCGGPTLVFVTQTHHPVLESHTGYIFAYYDIHFRKPKEMFFQWIAEAQVFALKRNAKLEMDPSRKPETVTAVDYILSSESQQLDEAFREERGRQSKGGYRPRRQRIDEEFDAENISDLQPTDLVEEDVNWFGDD